MAYLACDKDGTEWIFDWPPTRCKYAGWWAENYDTSKVQLPPGSIAKLIGRELTWEDEPYELK
ncbi:MAG: fructan hydrolase [Barnesiella sp.]|nr:fructan hydrolase [Barnesiella sp.]